MKLEVCLGWCLLAAGAAAQPATSVDIGGIVVSVSVSRTAQVFHIVDQLSEWDDASHRQYGRWAARALKLDDQDRTLLQQHAELRRARGWNNGFEQAFYVDEPIGVAARNATEAGFLTPTEASAEQAILQHFAPILEDLLDSHASKLADFHARLESEADRIAPIVRKMVYFSEVEEPITVPLYLIPNPEERNGGGGVNGGKLVLEVQTQPDPLPILFHECLHALLMPHKDMIAEQAESVGLTFSALNEGIAHAFSPGLTDEIGENDTLAERLVRNVLNEMPPSDSYVRAYSVALVIRPLLRSALETNETLTTFLPKAVDKWREFR